MPRILMVRPHNSLPGGQFPTPVDSPGCDSSRTIVPHIYTLDSTSIKLTSVPDHFVEISDFDSISLLSLLWPRT
jgi:hypothetical protein